MLSTRDRDDRPHDIRDTQKEHCTAKYVMIGTQKVLVTALLK